MFISTERPLVDAIRADRLSVNPADDRGYSGFSITAARARAALNVLLILLSGISSTSVQADDSRFSGVGRQATAKEIQVWDIDVRPDFKGLPKGSGNVLQGQQIWDARCASCHGTFGELTQMSAPIIGGTTANDIRAGKVAALSNPNTVLRSTMMKLATISTLWDYLYRAMPWDAPKSLSVDDTYAVTAYILNLAEIVPEEFRLSDQNIHEVQARLPNRDGMTQNHGLASLRGQPDTANTTCMKDCARQITVKERITGDAMRSHGDIASQNRSFGPVRGAPPGNKTAPND